MTHLVTWDQRDAFRPLMKLQVKDGHAILEAVSALALDSFPAAPTQLVGRAGGFRRLRVGAYRVIYEVTDTEVKVHELGHRRDIYDD